MNFCTKFNTKFGYITIVASNKGLKEIKLRKESVELSIENEILKKTKQQIIAYLDGKLKEFNIPIDYKIPDVLKETMKLPYGKTISYKELGKRVGKHPRAVARILAKNPLPIIIPCHRVIYSNGKIGGYSGGINWKTHLLKLENSIK